MDDFVKKLLTDWGLTDYIDVFRTNKINVDVPTLMTRESVNCLIPLIGDQLIFMAKLKEYKDDKNKIDETAVQAKSKESNVSYSDHASHCKLNKQVIGDDNSLSVEQVLLNTEKGRMTLEHRCEGKKLEDKQRDFIVRIIISTICNTYPDKKLTNDFWDSIGKQIVTLFPAEDLDCYYIPPIRKVNSTDKKSHAAKGKLLNRYRNEKSSYKEFCDKETNECIATSSSKKKKIPINNIKGQSGGEM
ncbi:hypothetical protein PV326_013228 [Microctonus aethiopoides]|nr:hypothetical protein PV326_013228 [Microctonus aethiopoides]